MKKLTALCFLAFFVCANSHAGSQEKNFAARWKSPPQVIVCWEGIDIEIVEKSLSYWEKELNMSIPSSRYEKCKIEPPWGSVYIDIDDSRISHRENGFTERVYTGDQCVMKSADVIIRSDLVGEIDLITHELGHALGLNHSSNPEDIMYPVQIFDHFDLTSSQ